VSERLEPAASLLRDPTSSGGGGNRTGATFSRPPIPSADLVKELTALRAAVRSEPLLEEKLRTVYESA
jgi:hypothetical protein